MRSIMKVTASWLLLTETIVENATHQCYSKGIVFYLMIVPSCFLSDAQK